MASDPEPRGVPHLPSTFDGRRRRQARDLIAALTPVHRELLRASLGVVCSGISDLRGMPSGSRVTSLRAWDQDQAQHPEILDALGDLCRAGWIEHRRSEKSGFFDVSRVAMRVLLAAGVNAKTL